MVKTEVIESIKRCDEDIAASKSTIKDLKQSLADDTEDLESVRELRAAKARVKELGKLVKADIATDDNLRYIRNEIEEEQFKLGDLKEILSAHLIDYHDTSKNSQVEIEPGIGKEVMVSAKLGKRKPYQENMGL